MRISFSNSPRHCRKNGHIIFIKLDDPKAVEKFIFIKLEFCCVNFHKIKLNSPKLKADAVSFFQLRLGHHAQGREPLIEVGFGAM
jgi:hypothetical protein